MNVDLVLARLGEAVGAASLEELAAFLEKDQSTLRVWRFRQRVPPSTIADVAKRTGRSVAWLEGADAETEEGPGATPSPRKVSAREPNPSFFARKEKQVNPQRPEEDFYFVPEIDVRAGAGPGQLVNSEEIIGKLAFRRSWLRQKGLRPDALSAVRANGDSMAPTIRDGDILLVDHSAEGLTTDGIYLIEEFNSVQCKRLQVELGHGVIVKSDNPAYKDQRLSFKQAAGLRIVGRVIWVGGER